jgi:hypothetical protein
MGRASKKRKEAEKRNASQLNALSFWALAVRMQAKVRLVGNDDQDQVWTLEACDSRMEKIIVQDERMKLHVKSLADIVQPIELSGFNKRQLLDLFEDDQELS